MNACRHRFLSFVVLSLVASLTTQVQATLTSHWKFDDAPGGTAADTAGGYNGTLNDWTNTLTSWVPGKIGNALNFDNTSANITVPSAPFGATWTAGGWYNAPLVATGTWHTFFRGLNHHIIGEAGTNVLGMYDNSTATGFNSTGFDLDGLSNGWHHIMAVGTGGTTKFYVDGTSVGTVGKQATEPTTYIGNLGTGQQFDDYLDDVGIFNVAYNDTFVKAIYSLGNEPTLTYNLALVDQLFTLFNAASGSTTINTVDWIYATGLSGTPGQVQFFGYDSFGNPGYILVLDNLGNGLLTPFVPEPSTFSLLALGVLGMAVRARRRRVAA